MSRSGRILVLAALAAVVAWLCWSDIRRVDRRASDRGRAPVSIPAPGTPPSPSLAREERSHLADGLGALSGDAREDLRIIDEIFLQYRSATHSGNPVGENEEITAALTGRNPVDFAFIPRGHPAINARGELCDRWGSPYFFHQLSAGKMEIRSAGPDHRMWTADDIVWTP